MMSIAAVLLAATFTRPMERVSTMDPVQARTIYDSHAIRLVYDTPLVVDYFARPYRLCAGYCELPRISEDGLAYTFVMRKGPASDMARGLERLRDPKEVSPNGWIMKDVESVTVKGSDVVEIRLKRPVGHFPWLMSMSATAVMAADGSGTGAFRLEHWRKNHEMTFVRKVPSERGFDAVRYLVVDDMSTQWLMFLKGELDFLSEISRDNWDSVIGADGKVSPALTSRGIRLCTIPMMDTMHIGINMRDSILGGNRKLRQALNAAFDFPAWKRFHNGRVVESGGPVPNGVEGALPAETFAYRFDLDKARRLMEEAGFRDGIDPATGKRLVLTLAIGRASQESREAGELMASFYERIGIRLELKFYTWDAFLKAVNDGRVQLYRMGWVGDYPNAQNFLQLFHSENVSPGINHSNYVNAEFDDAYARCDWKRCQEIVREDCPWVFTHFNVSNSLVGPKVGNFQLSAFPDGNEQYYEVRK